ncbi:AtuA-related protein [Glutamicibacter mishrai]|uniref:AtuA-related protein n=1 Tax=Glutamicibacter mishrai TaxID=1775880 RepID=UPI003F793A46
MEESSTRTSVDELADVRTGDKADTLILSVFPRTASDYEFLRQHLTESKVADHFGSASHQAVTRVLMPELPGIVFQLPGVLGGGVTGSPTLDGHGKTLSYHLLSLKLP